MCVRIKKCAGMCFLNDVNTQLRVVLTSREEEEMLFVPVSFIIKRPGFVPSRIDDVEESWSGTCDDLMLPLALASLFIVLCSQTVSSIPFPNR